MLICTVKVFGVFVFEFGGATTGETPLYMSQISNSLMGI
jgi:hypothetical protein